MKTGGVLIGRLLVQVVPQAVLEAASRGPGFGKPASNHFGQIDYQPASEQECRT